MRLNSWITAPGELTGPPATVGERMAVTAVITAS
jgi:hypothetical protein